LLQQGEETGRLRKTLLLSGIAWEANDSLAAGTSALGALLNRRTKTILSESHEVLPPEDGLRSKGLTSIVGGTFRVVKSGVRLSLKLVDAATGNVFSQVSQVLSQEALSGLTASELVPPDSDNAVALATLLSRTVSASSSAFKLRISTDRGANGAYVEGDPLTIFIETERDAYVRIYHVAWKDRRFTMVFPNKHERNNFIRSGAVRRIPEEADSFVFEVSKPYGVDAIVAIAQTEPFEDDAYVESHLDGQAEVPSEEASEGVGTAGQGVEVAGDYVVATEVDEERAKSILAKGLVVRERKESDPKSYSLSGSVGATPGSTAAKAFCYYTTVPKLF